MPSNPKILFILPTTSQPRYHKRINAAYDAGFDVHVAAFTRGYYNLNKLPNCITQFYELPEIQDGNYLRRIPKLVSSIGKIKSASKQNDFTAFYTFSHDILLSSVTCRKQLVIHEIGDLRTAERSRSSHLLRLSEKILFRVPKHIVLTSKRFLDKIPISPQQHCRITILENLLDKYFAQLPPPPQNVGKGKKIRIGVIGLLRYTTIFPLIDFVQNHRDKYTLSIWGDGPLADTISLKCSETPDVTVYNGPFKSPEDLPRIYSNIDINYVVYDNTQINVQLALPNKLYESQYFGVPLLAAPNTALATEAINRGIGFELEGTDYKSISKFFQSISIDQLSDRQLQSFRVTDRLSLIDRSEEFFTKVIASI